MKTVFISVFLVFSSSLMAQNYQWTAGFNVHKLGLFAPTYLRNENIRLGYWFHPYHQAGIELGVYRDARIVYPTAGIYYRFQPLKGRFRPFFEGRGKLFLVRNIFSGNELSFVWAGYGGLSFDLSRRFSVDAGIGRSTIDWDQFIEFNFKF